MRTILSILMLATVTHADDRANYRAERERFYESQRQDQAPELPPAPPEQAKRTIWDDDTGWEPEPIQMPRVRVTILTVCGLDEEMTWCARCNEEAAALRRFKRTQHKWTVGTKDTDVFRVADIDTEHGKRLDREYGRNGVPLTQVMRGVPVTVIEYPDREPKVIVGWHGGDPTKDAALWYLSSLVGHRRNTPECWAASAQFDPVGVGLSKWLECGDYTYAAGDGWGITIPAGRLAQYAFGPAGRRQIAPAVWLVLPEDFRPVWPPANAPTLRFQNPPYVEIGLGPFKRREYLDRIEFAPDNSRLTIHARGWRSFFPINLDWSQDAEQSWAARCRGEYIAEN